MEATKAKSRWNRSEKGQWDRWESSSFLQKGSAMYRHTTLHASQDPQRDYNLQEDFCSTEWKRSALIEIWALKDVLSPIIFYCVCWYNSDDIRPAGINTKVTSTENYIPNLRCSSNKFSVLISCSWSWGFFEKLSANASFFQVAHSHPSAQAPGSHTEELCQYTLILKLYLYSICIPSDCYANNMISIFKIWKMSQKLSLALWLKLPPSNSLCS